MIHIVICESDKELAFDIEIIIKKLLMGEDVFFSKCVSADEVICCLEQSYICDLLITDIDLNDMSGYDLARKFKRIYPQSTIVFYAEEQYLSVEAFKIKPFRFLLKSFRKSKMDEEMKDVIDEVRKNKKRNFLVGHYRHSQIEVELEDIMYIVNSKRGSRIYVRPNCDLWGFKEPILIDLKLIEFYNKYGKYGFEYASARYIVNLCCIKKVSSKEVHLTNNEILTVSRHFYKSFIEKLAKVGL